MIDRHQKDKFFRILYKICKERNINFHNIPWSTSPETKNIFKLFIGAEKYFNEFVRFYQIQEDRNKSLIILHRYNHTDLKMENMENINVKKKNIYGGFMYFKKNSYQLYDKSFLKAMNTIKDRYMESKYEQ